MKKLESFKAQSPPKRRVSRLKKYENEILELYAEGYQVEQSQDFLAANGIKVSTRRIYQFLKQNLNTQNSFLQTSAATGGQKSKPQQQSAQNSSKAVSAYHEKLLKLSKEQT